MKAADQNQVVIATFAPFSYSVDSRHYKALKRTKLDILHKGLLSCKRNVLVWTFLVVHFFQEKLLYICL